MRRRTFGLGMAATAMASKARAAAMRSVTINYGVPQIPISTAPIFSVPRRLGLWPEAGLDVTSQGAQGAGPALQQLIAGQVMLTFTGLPAAMELINKGAPIKVVASVYGRNVFYPVVLATSPIKEIADLKGKTIGVTGIASTNALWIRAILRSYGVADDDIHLVATGDGASALSALQHGQVDALQLVEADYDRFETTGVALRRLNASPILQKLSFVQGLVANTRTIAQDPKPLAGLLHGIAGASFYCQAHPDVGVRMHWAEYPETKPQGDAAKALAAATRVLANQISAYTVATDHRFGVTTPAKIEMVRDTLADLGQLSKRLPAEAYFTDAFLDAANDFDMAALLARSPNL
jgi:NitT/TauT family transport system substrate-binding protein